MSTDSNASYEFGGFCLKPRTREFLHFDRPLELNGKAFDVLQYLIMNKDRVIPESVLVDEIWRGESIRPGYIPNVIGKIRRLLDDEPREPKFIKTIHGKNAYRFIAEVVVKNDRDQASADIGRPTAQNPSPTEYTVESHIFVAMYLGVGVYKKLNSPVRSSPWLTYKEYKIEGGRLCLQANGIGVWHLIFTNSFRSLTEIAAWRKTRYEDIFQDRHPLARYAKQLIESATATAADAYFAPVAGKPGYAYSLITPIDPRPKDQPRTRRLLEFLSCPKPLEPDNTSRTERSRLRIIEQQLLEHGLNSFDMREFGLTGVDAGYASWEGVSYASFTDNNKQMATLIEFQIALHSLWWFSKSLATCWIAGDAKAKRSLTDNLTQLKTNYLAIKNIEAKDSTSQRTMIEAVLSMNRLREVIDETIELLS
jgi:DNA-binding winged helix-turn-helix (wHTH) protein